MLLRGGIVARNSTDHDLILIFARRAYCVGGSPKMMCVRPSVCTCVTIKNDQVLNGKSSLSKVNGSKRDQILNGKTSLSKVSSSKRDPKKGPH